MPKRKSSLITVNLVGLILQLFCFKNEEAMILTLTVSIAYSISFVFFQIQSKLNVSSLVLGVRSDKYSLTFIKK